MTLSVGREVCTERHLNMKLILLKFLRVLCAQRCLQMFCSDARLFLNSLVVVVVDWRKWTWAWGTSNITVNYKCPYLYKTSFKFYLSMVPWWNLSEWKMGHWKVYFHLAHLKLGSVCGITLFNYFCHFCFCFPPSLFSNVTLPYFSDDQSPLKWYFCLFFLSDASPSASALWVLHSIQ